MPRRKNQPNSLNLVAGFDAKRASDTLTCWLTGATFLHDDRIVLADRNNTKLKLFSNKFKFLDSIPLDNKPFDVAEIEHGCVAVSLPELKVKFYDVGEVFAMNKLLTEQDTKQPCFGLAQHNGHLYVICEMAHDQMGCVNIYNENGEIINHITDVVGGIGFIGSLKIAVSPETQQLYYQELTWTTWKVCGATENRHMPWVSKATVFQGCPVGLAATHDGTFVANVQNNSIQWLDPENGKISDLKHLRTDRFCPFSLALNNNCSQLLVTNSHELPSCDDNNVVRIFDVVRND